MVYVYNKSRSQKMCTVISYTIRKQSGLRRSLQGAIFSRQVYRPRRGSLLTQCDD